MLKFPKNRNSALFPGARINIESILKEFPDINGLFSRLINALKMGAGGANPISRTVQHPPVQ